MKMFLCLHQLKEEVQRLIQELAPGGGYLLAAVHSIQPDVPPENVCTMFETALAHGRYPHHYRQLRQG